MANQKNGAKAYRLRDRWLKIIGTILLIAVICLIAFSYFRITTEGRFAFREAKNVRLAFQMLEIELRGSGKVVYDFGKPNGLAQGVMDRLAEVISEGGEVRLTEYNRKTHMVTGFTYTLGKYKVTYECDENSIEHWRVEYSINIFKFDGDK